MPAKKYICTHMHMHGENISLQAITPVLGMHVNKDHSEVGITALIKGVTPKYYLSKEL